MMTLNLSILSALVDTTPVCSSEEGTIFSSQVITFLGNPPTVGDVISSTSGHLGKLPKCMRHATFHDAIVQIINFLQVRVVHKFNVAWR